MVKIFLQGVAVWVLGSAPVSCCGREGGAIQKRQEQFKKGAPQQLILARKVHLSHFFTRD
jgi:hypothetical protein